MPYFYDIISGVFKFNPGYFLCTIRNIGGSERIIIIYYNDIRSVIFAVIFLYIDIVNSSPLCAIFFAQPIKICFFYKTGYIIGDVFRIRDSFIVVMSNLLQVILGEQSALIRVF